ncbi:MAG TPA: Fe-S cluster assembly scaffold protein NifU [bacterium]|jgi:nitrogen fixation NifU-like protein|nr:Fe-S cluster assembly scaffold protein NifU [bacterium]HPA56019.1 Fe-S cluster assembly scaffold protein NifU [bacterium]HQI04256.1 Fe-S cluster assembly scaffold protein NifU [bacterium]HQJ59842.1 Fe-S cluster assembly scaffold protein NifU [bacterium]HQN72857.1 Fe-S cluster assembly scaffold protein NifU [bacterium]
MNYTEKVMDHFLNPRNIGKIEDADAVAEIGNATCGDIIKLYLKITPDGVIENITFQTFGCGAAIATSSMTTEMVKGKTIDEALEITREQVADELGGLPANKMHCSNLAADALHKAIKEYKAKNGIK